MHIAIIRWMKIMSAYFTKYKQMSFGKMTKL